MTISFQFKALYLSSKKVNDITMMLLCDGQWWYYIAKSWWIHLSQVWYRYDIIMIYYTEKEIW